MEHCQMISLEDLRAMQRQGDAFQPIPVWIEVNIRYYKHSHVGWFPLAPGVLTVFYDTAGKENADVFVEGGGTHELLSYGKSWRLWYACGTERPACDEPWQLFSWDSGKGEFA